MKTYIKKKDVVEGEINELVQNAPTLTPEQTNNMEKDISLSEAAIALKSMKNNKSPGSDGFTAEFFKVFWKTLGPFIVRSLNEGLKRGELSATQKEGILVCIPKGDKPREYIKNWRPISLLNVVYKIGSACISNRIKEILPLLISEDQSGFVAGRYMGDNIRLIYDTMFHLNQRKLPGLLLCIDFEKAFDSVSWSFLHKVITFFGFGPIMCRWIKTFMYNIKSAVTVNGTMSSWFNIGRGCRQGDPVSPYLFILCVEILGIMIRENKLIKGIKINDTEHKITQFADDTQMLTHGDVVSFEQIINTINLFGNRSGLFMNSSKTQVVWLGSKRGSRVKYMQHIEMDWNPLKFKILGIWLTADLHECDMLNYNDKLSEIKILFRIWIKRQITPLGRIAVLKSLILSKIVHLWLLLPNPPDYFMAGLQKMCFQFIWKKKQDRISRITAVKNILDGGLGAVDVVEFANSLKLTWIKKYKNSSHGWKSVLESACPLMKLFEKYGSNIPIDSTKVNKFWEHTFLAYRKFCKKVNVEEAGEIVAEPLFYHENIKICAQVVDHKRWIEHGAANISHVMHNNGSFLTLDEFNTKFDLNVHFLNYNGCIRAIKKYLQSKDVAIPDNNAHDVRKALTLIFTNKKGTKRYYNMLIQKEQPPKCCDKWNSKLNKDINWKITFAKIQKIQEIKLKWFQIRIVHRIIGTNRSLKWMNLKNDDLCDFCKEETETIVHLFWECDIIQRFWKELETIVQEKCEHLKDLVINKELILFGHTSGYKTDQILDTILLCVKFYIYKCKLGKVMPHSRIMFKQVYDRYKIDKHLSFIDMNYELFKNKWQPYIPLIGDLRETGL